MITTIIGLIGGLTIALSLLVPLAVKLAHKVWNRMTRRRTDNAVLQVESSPLRLGKKIKRIKFKESNTEFRHHIEFSKFKTEGFYIFSLDK
jgi:hypothetical protein